MTCFQAHLSCSSQACLFRDGTPHSVLGPPTSVSNQENDYTNMPTGQPHWSSTLIDVTSWVLSTAKISHYRNSFCLLISKQLRDPSKELKPNDPNPSKEIGKRVGWFYFLVVVIVAVVWDRGSLCNPGYPGTYNEVQAGFKRTEICLCLPPNCYC